MRTARGGRVLRARAYHRPARSHTLPAAFAVLATAALPATAQTPAAEIRLAPGERVRIASAATSLAEAARSFRSLDSLIVTVDSAGVIQARDWGSALVVAVGDDSTGLLVRVAPLGIYDFSGVLGINRSARRSGTPDVSRSVAGSLRFHEVAGGTLVESDCGTDALLAYDASTFSVTCGEASLSFRLTEGGQISGSGSQSTTVQEARRQVCTRLDEQGRCIRTGWRGGRRSAYLRGTVEVRKRGDGDDVPSREPPPPPITLALNSESAEAVADLFARGTVTDQDLERVFALAGVQALYQQVRRFDPDATQEVFTSTLRAAVEGRSVERDPFQFQTVRRRIDEIAPTVEWIRTHREALAAELGARIAEYSPPLEPMDVPVFLVLGGSSDGWARDGTFHVAVHYFRDDVEGMKLLMAHELFHVAQRAFLSGATVPEGAPLHNVELLLRDTLAEGTASLLWWPDELPAGIYVDGVLRAKLDRNRRRAPSIFALFDLMLSRAHADPSFDPGSIYDLGFSGQWDSPLYYLGYRIARAVDEHRGRETLRALLARPAVELFQVYVELYRERAGDEALIRFSPEAERTLDALQQASAGS